MAVTLRASVDDKGVKLALAGMKGAMDGGKIAGIAARAMVHDWLPQVFARNVYGWKPPLRGGMPLNDTRTHLASAFVYSVAGAVATIRNLFKFAVIHDKGKTITAKNAKYLRFKIGRGADARWAQKKSVTIPQRRFMFWHTDSVKLVVHRVNLFIAQSRKRPA